MKSRASVILALILFYPALCIPDDAGKGQMMFAKFDPENILEQMKCGPMKLGQRYAESEIGMDAIKEITKYDRPVLLLYGTEDSIVDVSYARQAAEGGPYCLQMTVADHVAALVYISLACYINRK